MTSQRIALHFHRLAEAGGAERMVIALAAALADRGAEPLLVSWDTEQSRSFHPIDPRVPWRRLGFRPGLADKLRRVRALTRVLRAHQADALVGFVVSGDRVVHAAARLAGAAMVAAERNAPSIYRLRYGRVHRWCAFALLGTDDRIVVQMPSFVAGYPARLRRRISVIGNPVPPARGCAVPARPAADGRFTLLSVTRLDPVQKRLDRLVAAFARLAPAHPDWHLRIVGDGPQRAALQAQVAACGLTGRVHLDRATEDVGAAYRAAHLFAIPSLWEGFPNALAEAFAHGLPAVGFAGAEGVADLIGRDCGWLATGLDDPGSLADVLGQAMAAPDQRAARGAAARAAMLHYAPAVQFDLWHRLLSEIVAGRRR